MKYYYLGGLAGMILVFIFTCSISCISSCTTENKYIDMAEERANNYVMVRYFSSDEYSTAKVATLYVKKNEKFTINYVPEKKGSYFIGWYDSDDINAQLVVTANGNSIMNVSKDIILYPVFEEDK